eukprot:14230539-Ditylum_brightwellii.AAC.1
MDHLNNLIHSFMNDFEIIAEEFEQLIESSRDDTPDPVFLLEQGEKDSYHDVLWPRHGPDPNFLLKQ